MNKPQRDYWIRIIAQAVLSTAVWGLGMWAIMSSWYIYKIKSFWFIVMILIFMLYVVLGVIFGLWGRWW